MARKRHGNYTGGKIFGAPDRRRLNLVFRDVIKCLRIYVRRRTVLARPATDDAL